jgi:hypothetical protein
MKAQYPDDYNPPNRGRCEVCGYETRSWDPRWLVRCPQHWQELARWLRGA